MKLYSWMTLLPIVSIGVGLGAPLSPAHASVYRSASNQTKLLIANDFSSQPTSAGFYTTRINGQNWFGSINVTRVSVTSLTTVFKGTFEDSQDRSGARCTGDLTLVRSKGSRAGIPTLQATWRVTGGTNCPFVGKITELIMPEALPRSDYDGNFSIENANTSMGAASMNETWRSWRVVSSDGEMNCRATPNGRIRKVYKRTDTIRVENTDSFENRYGNSIKLFNGQPWLHTSDRCFVRANSRYILPVSLPF
jgi:hypothetical protein